MGGSHHFSVRILLKMCSNAIDNFREGSRRTKRSETLQLLKRGHAPRHVFKARLVSLVVRDIRYRRLALRALFDDACESLHRNLLCAANVDDLTYRSVVCDQQENRSNRVAHVAEATRLLS